MFMQAWQYFGLSQPKTTGIVGAAGALALASLVAWKPLELVAKEGKYDVEGLAATTLLWAIYAALVAAVGLWDFDPRGLGLYAIFPAVLAAGGAIASAVTGPALWVACPAITAVAFGMVFFYLGVPFKGLRLATAWVLVVAGVAHALLHFMVLGEVPGLV